MVAGESKSSTIRSMTTWIPSTFWPAAFVQTGFLVALVASDGYDVARAGEIGRVVLTYTTVFALFGLIHLAAPTARWARRLKAVAFFFFVAVNFARFETAGSFDYGFAHENFRELASPAGRHIVLSNVRPWELALLFVLPLAIGGLAARGPARPRPPRSARRLAAALACLAMLVVPPLRHASSHESLTGFAVSALHFYGQSRAAEAAINGALFPFVKDSVPTPEATAISGGVAPRPHVILLFMESWSAAYAGEVSPDGRALTPVFDERRRDALTFEHFYGNSVQSSRGHFATLCSLIPLTRGKETIDLPETRLHCLPELLRELGYATAFYSATDEPGFDKTGEWMTRIGFGDVRFADRRDRDHDPAMWGMGVQDDVFYRRFFGILDEKVAREPGKPQLAVLASASNHYPFDESPKHVPAPGYATKYQRNFVASLSASDAWLATFFDELDKRPAFRDAIVVLVGDHSFPADEHGLHFNGLGAYEEAFRTGFMLRWKGHVAAKVVTDRAASQIDIAPTIVDLLQVRAKTHFTGTSLLSQGNEHVPVPLVQPYDGVRLAAVKWPFKLVRHEAADQEQLYDLAKDPAETEDRIADPRLAAELTELRGALVRIHANQAVVRANRVWPPP